MIVSSQFKTMIVRIFQSVVVEIEAYKIARDPEIAKYWKIGK